MRRPPSARAIQRPRLTRPLTETAGQPLVTLVAPAGYGKTTLLCDWADRDERPFAWVTLDAEDNDPASAVTGPASDPPPSLTTAELTARHFLPTGLSFREIGERVYVSANTVKTQANAVYRKLGVLCRADAVSRARQLGLLDAWP